MKKEPMLLATYYAGEQSAPRLYELGFTVFQTDDDHISTDEISEGVWDFSKYEEKMNAVKQLGGKWMFFPHNSFPPKWYRETVPYTRLKCLEHDATIEAFSIWEPKAYEYLDRAYKALYEHFGNDPENIYAFYIGVYGDYGECMFPAACRVLYNQEWYEIFGDMHNHYGWWCGDVLARKDFHDKMMQKYGDIEKLNQAWNSAFTAGQQIGYPQGADTRRWWLDFVRWYFDSMTYYGRACATTLKRYFPNQMLVYPMGCEDEDPRIGQDYSALAKMSAEEGVEIRSTHGGFFQFDANAVSQMNHLGSACKFYKVPFWTEPQNMIPPYGQVGRIFECLCAGAAAFWDWNRNVDDPEGGKVIAKYRHLLVKDMPLVEAAILFPQTDHYLKPGQAFPKQYRKLGRRARVICHFDVADEAMIHDGMLDNYRFLLHFEGVVFEEKTLRAIDNWIKGGGVFCCLTKGPLETVEGDTGIFSAWMDGKSLECGGSVVTRLGKGAVCVFWGDDEQMAPYFEFPRQNLYLAPPNESGSICSIDTHMEGVYSLIYPDRRV